MRYGLAALLLLPLQDLSLADVNDWCAQLENVDLKALGETKFDLAVVDHSRDHPLASTFAPDDYAALKKSAGGAKLVLAYAAVGVAQNNRFYWRKEWSETPPAWLGAKDPARKVSFHAKYWDPAWQALVAGNKDALLDRIIDAGFDGAVLDGIDSYVYWQNAGVQDARAKMVEWVSAISLHARKRNAKFLVVAHGGEELLADGRFLAAIQGIGRSGAYLTGEGKRREAAESRAVEDHLDRAVAEGRRVFILEQTESKADAEWVHARAREKKYVPYIGPPGLGKVQVFAGLEPD